MSYWLPSRTASLPRSEQLLWACGRSSSAVSTTTVAARSLKSSRVQLEHVKCRSTLALRPGLCVDSARASSTILGPHEQRRHLSSTPYRRSTNSSPSSNGSPDVISTTQEHSPCHNIATLSVSNPSKLNIVNSALLQDFTQKCHDLSKDANLRAVVLTGAPTNPGKAASWIGGADIKEMAGLSSSEEARAFINRIHEACEALRAIPVPVIASIGGFCLGAGMEIAAACDLRIATRGSVFGMPEVKVGIPSVVEAAYLPGLIGMGRTRRLLYLAENIDAVTAERWGFVERLVDGKEELERATEEWVEMLVGMGPKAIRSQKRLMQRWENCGVEEGIEAGAKAYAAAFSDGGAEPQEFMGRFLGRKR